MVNKVSEKEAQQYHVDELIILDRPLTGNCFFNTEKYTKSEFHNEDGLKVVRLRLKQNPVDK
jgi:hypothetical protein